MKSYMEFLKDKVIKAPVSGIEVSPDELNPALKPHQRDAVLWALRGGRRALNADYYRDGCFYLKREEDNQATPSLFDFFPPEPEAPEHPAQF